MDTIVLLVFGILITLIVLYYVVNGYLEGTTRILYKTDLNQSQNPVDVSSSPEYSYGMWINVSALAPGESTIIERKNELKLSIKNGKLILLRDKVTYEILDSFPLQKMVYITITVEDSEDKNKSFINAYIDGKMVKSYQGKPVKTYTYSVETITGPFGVKLPIRVTFTPWPPVISIGTFDAKLFGFKRWKHALSPSAVAVEYEATNLQKMFGNYNVDISLLENDKLTKRFSVF